jgi:hypothetical protein
MADYPSFLLCARCSTAEKADEATGWHALLVPRGTTLDICPRCAVVVKKVLRSPPDVLEESR